MSSAQTLTVTYTKLVDKPKPNTSKPGQKLGNPSVFEQLHNFRSLIPKEILREWERPTGLRSAIPIAQDWLIITAAHQLYSRYPGWGTFAVSVILMAWGQRGLSNLAHDSIHRNLAASKNTNDLLANVFLAPPLMSTSRLQRLDHTAHHHYLGTKDDPDHGIHNETSLRHYRNGRFDHTSIGSLFLYDFPDPKVFLNYALGSLTSAPLLITGWWLAATLLFSFLDPNPSSHAFQGISPTFPILFHTARLTLSYACFIFREIIDHSGLPSSSILEFTRTSPCCNVFQRFLQPHDDNYHLLHHLMPKVPMSKLHETHLWLVDNVPVYEKANRHTTYFSGENPLFTQSLHKHTLEKKAC
ncbi:hypothetical protein EJ04DRAFT_136518 [Polyplosphaeria fusca]|uniref:Fatty acid desaturase domain-containing protein n=1 Tax=Polyplosphaeria fusca TaxID=682080 RepID=A0A9P4UWU7_9PLEO|nr:hypothetical protein EJ04DRAFT_136518 [Polyplosphaeria fusca]